MRWRLAYVIPILVGHCLRGYLAPLIIGLEEFNVASMSLVRINDKEKTLFLQVSRKTVPKINELALNLTPI